MERTASVYDQGRILSVVKQLSAREVQMVILFAEHLLMQPTSDLGRNYVAMLLQDGADATAILAAVQAIQHVDQRLAQEMDFQAGLNDLRQRTEKHFQGWCREKGIDYELLSEAEFTELVEGAIRQVREER